MARTHVSISWFSALLLGLVACNPAYADRSRAPAHGQTLAAPSSESPYKVDLVADDGTLLDVYQHRGRFYVLGSAGERYTILVTNPTARRVEAVVSVDGLDVIDGKTADLRKRGYVVPAYGELRIDGFRVSTQEVATFRFSSVAQSYAGRKGQARNVGVIGVALFAEQAPPELILNAPVTTPTPQPRRYDYRDDLADSYDDDRASGSAKSAPAPVPAAEEAEVSGSYGGATLSASPGAPAPAKSRARRGSSVSSADRSRPADECCGQTQKKERPGLGTEFGEQRGSTVTWTSFVRANPTRPTSMAELRYNDADGLEALGIRIAPPVDAQELNTRETANPFPGSFAEPPR